MALLLVGSLAGLTNSFAADTLPPQEAEAEIVDSTLASQESALVAQASAKQGLNANQILALDSPQLPVAEINGREIAATPRRIKYLVSLSVRGVYDDNINISSTDREEDFFTAIEPRLIVGFGDVLVRQDNFVALSYFPSAFIFASHSEENAVQHSIQVEAQYRFPRLTVDFLQSVQLLDGSDLGPVIGTSSTGSSGAGRVNLDVSGRTQVNFYNSRLSGNYSLTGKTFLTGGLGYSVTDYSTLIDSSVISANAYFNYTYSPKLTVGLGLTGGYDIVSEAGQDQVFEQLNARASYEVTGKVSATVTAGVEFRQYGGGGSNAVSPVFEGGLTYQPFDGTNVALTISRRTLNSATLAGQDYYSTNITLIAQQRFLQRFFFGLGIGYENSTYFSTGSEISSTRDDNYFYIEPSLDFNITRFWSAGIYYLHRESNSSLSIFSFYDNQFGARTSFTF